jgi:hypothetical protein
MSEIASARINTFGPSLKADFVPTSEQLITLTYGQLQDLVTQAVEKAIQPLQDRIDTLEAIAGSQNEKIAALEFIEEHDVSRLALDIAYDRQRLAKLEHHTKEPGKTEISRADKIEKYLSSRPDHKANFETLKGHLGIDKDRLNEAIKTLMAASPGRYGITRAPGDKRKRTLVMLPK